MSKYDKERARKNYLKHNARHVEMMKRRKAQRHGYVRDKNPLVTHEIGDALEKEKRWKKIFLSEQHHWQKLMATYQGQLWKKANRKLINLKVQVRSRLIREHAQKKTSDIVPEFRELLRADQPTQPTEETK